MIILSIFLNSNHNSLPSFNSHHLAPLSLPLQIISLMIMLEIWMQIMDYGSLNSCLLLRLELLSYPSLPDRLPNYGIYDSNPSPNLHKIISALNQPSSRGGESYLVNELLFLHFLYIVKGNPLRHLKRVQL